MQLVKVALLTVCIAIVSQTIRAVERGMSKHGIRSVGAVVNGHDLSSLPEWANRSGDQVTTVTTGANDKSSLPKREGVRGPRRRQEPSDSITSATNENMNSDEVATPQHKSTPIGPDIIIETAGAPGTALNAAQRVRRGGKAVIVGFNHQDQTLNFGRAHMGEKTIMGSSATGHGQYQKAIDLIATGQVNVKPLISTFVSLNRGIQDGFERMLKPEKDVYRILVGNG